MTALGGSSYFMALFVIVILEYLLIYDIVTKKVKPIWIMFIPMALETIGLIDPIIVMGFVVVGIIAFATFQFATEKTFKLPLFCVD